MYKENNSKFTNDWLSICNNKSIQLAYIAILYSTLKGAPVGPQNFIFG